MSDTSTTTLGLDLGGDLEDKLDSAASATDELADALGGLDDFTAIDELNAALDQMGSASADAASGIGEVGDALGDAAGTEEFGAISEDLGEMGDAAGGASDEVADLDSIMADSGESLFNTTDAAAGLSNELGDMAKPAGDAAGGAGAMTEAFEGFIATDPATAIKQTVEACIALDVAILAAAAAMTAFGLESADSKRSLNLSLEAMLGSKEAADKLNASIDELGARVPVAKDKLEEMAKGLALAGLTGDQLTHTLESLADVTAVAGQEAADKLEQLVKRAAAAGHFEASARQLAGTGVALTDLYAELASRLGKSQDEIAKLMKDGKITVEQGVDAMNAVLQKKFGGEAGAAAMGLSAQIQHLKDTLGDIFEDVDIQPFLEAMKDFLSIFESADGAGGDLKSTLVGAFQSILSAAVAVEPAVKGFFEGLIAAGHTMYTALEPIGHVLVQILGVSGGSQEAMWKGIGEQVAYAAAGLAVVAAIVGGVLVVAAVALAAPFILVGLAIAAVVGIVVGFVDGFIAAYDAIASIDWGSIGSAIAAPFVAAWDYVSGLVGEFAGLGADLVAGIVSGILAGANAVVNAVVQVITFGLAAGRSASDSHSPSRKFADLGKDQALGVAVGMNDNSRAPAAAAAEMIGQSHAAAMGAAGRGRPANTNAGAGAGKGGGPSVVIHVHLPPGVNPQNAQQLGETAGNGAADAFNRRMRDMREAG